MPTAPEREPYVPKPNCTLSVSPWTIETFSIGMPRREETSWANVVSWPWPWLCEPVSTSTVPIGLTLTSADSQRPPPRPSEPTAADGASPQASIYAENPTPRSLPLAAEAALRWATPL